MVKGGRSLEVAHNDAGTRRRVRCEAHVIGANGDMHLGTARTSELLWKQAQLGTYAVGGHSSGKEVRLAEEFGNETAGRAMVYVLWGGKLLETARPQNSHPVSQEESLILIVGHEEGG
jgi:hypothetical protein